MFIDTHCHLFVKYYQNIETVIEKMNENVMIVSGINDETNMEVIKLCNKYKNIYGTLGIHPSEVENYNNNSMLLIEKNINNLKIVGIGEIGLDYYYGNKNINKQQDLFIKQLKLAIKYSKPIVIHSRDAIEDTYNILKRNNIKNKIIMHCFSSSVEMAEKFVELGAMIGIGGVVTFKNAKTIKEVVKQIKLENILLETDSPFLAPEPYRGKINEPVNIKLIAEKVAEIKNISLEQVYIKTTNNAISQFDLNVEIC